MASAVAAAAAAAGGGHHRKGEKEPWAHLSIFHHLLVLRCLRPDKLAGAVQDFIALTLGRVYVEPPTFDLQQSYGDSSCDTPLVFVLSPGADPTAELLRLADMKGFGRKLKLVSLGQGQGPIAEAAITEAVDSGLWVCLQNCHLAASRMGTLERLVEEITPDRTHPEFRLWLTSMPEKSFPVSVLQRAIKMTNEPPKGLRANLLGSYAAINEPWFEDCAQPHAWKKLIFGMCFFHAVVQERRRFGPLGWNEVYNFTDADLSISISQLRMFLDDSAPSDAVAALADYRNMRVAAKGGAVAPPAAPAPAAGAAPGAAPGSARAPSSARRGSMASGRHSVVDDDTPVDPFDGIPLVVPFPALQYLVASCNYGGRVTDDKDARALEALLRTFYCEAALEGGYPLSASGTYYVPLDGPLTSYVEYIKSLPLMDAPEVFGLHDNAAITTAVAEARTMLGTMLEVLPPGTSPKSGGGGGSGGGGAAAVALASSRSAGGGGSGGGAASPLLALVADVTAKIPRPFDVEAVAAKYPVRHEQSMNTVLVQELIRYNRLLGVVRSTLASLNDAVQGLVVMTSQLEAMSSYLLANRVPPAWHAAGYPSLKPLGSWVADLCARVAFFTTWVAEGPPAAFWVSGFFFTQSFLTGQLQNYARKTRQPIDTIEFNFQVLTVTNPATVTAPPDDGAHIYGLFLEGAAWDSGAGVMCEQAPRELLFTMPVIWIKPHVAVGGASDGHGGGGGAGGSHVYHCPVYRTALRRGTLSTTGHSTMWVMNAMLPIGPTASADHYIKRGAALLCQTSE